MTELILSIMGHLSGFGRTAVFSIVPSSGDPTMPISKLSASSATTRLAETIHGKTFLRFLSSVACKHGEQWSFSVDSIG